MRAREFIGEAGKSTLRKSAVDSIPGARIYPELDNSSPYHSYRYGIALAGAPDIPMDKDGPTGQKLVTISYSKADDEIVDAASKQMGFKNNQLTPKGSTELDSAETASPVANWMNPPKEKKDKKK